MLAAFNILVVLLVLLIAYWWGNQGFFSAIIHLVCVIVAGALALAFWEPLTLGLLLRGGFFDSYAWGFGLLGLFVVSLFILRLATNKLVPGNVDHRGFDVSALFAQFAGGPGQRCIVDIPEQDESRVPGDAACRDQLAESPGAAGNQYRPVVEARHAVLLERDVTPIAG